MLGESCHDDYVLDAKYDYYGRRFATCSSDHSIRVWDQVEGIWRTTGRIPKAARAAISRLSWSFPEYGQLIAVSSEDGSVQIYEEQADVAAAGGAAGGNGSMDDYLSSRSKWANRATLKDGSKAVTDIEYAPRHLGLRLASASADGVVRIYDAVDVMNLSHWPLQDAFEAERCGQADPPLCLSWNPCRFDPPGLVVGGNAVRVWQYDEPSRKWEAVAMLGQEGEAVHDVSWAPRMGRSHHMVATAGKDMTLRVHHLRYAPGTNRLTYCPEESRDLDTKSEVWRVEWNVTGTLLAASGDDGIVKLWKKSYPGPESGGQQQPEWVQVKVLSRPLIPPEGSDIVVVH